jgi:hypothetical protein
MILEIQSRQQSVAECNETTCNIKETRGGLRDIEAIALILKAYLGIMDPIVKDFFKEIKIYLPDLSKQIDSLNDSIYVLRTFRDLYRITVAAEDTFNYDYFSRLATIFQQYNHPEWGEPELICQEIKTTLENSSKACQSVIRYLTEQVN